MSTRASLRVTRGTRSAWAALVLVSFLAACRSAESRPSSRRDALPTSPTGDVAAPAFLHLRSNLEIVAAMDEWVARHPRWARRGILGYTYLGREIPYWHWSDHEHEADKIGVWVDGAIHGGEIATSEVVAALAETLAERIAKGDPPDWLARVDLYLVPILNADARDLCMRPPYAVQRANLRPVDDDHDGLLDEESFQDLNGDGRITTFHVAGRGFVFEGTDADGDGLWGEDLPGGVDLNRNYPVSSRTRARDWVPEPETQAVVDFWLAHPELRLAVSYHTSRNMFIWPHADLDEVERERYARLSAHFLRHFPGVEWRLFDDPQAFGAAQPLTGMNVEWFHDSRGATAFILEIGPDSPPTQRLAKSESFVLPDGQETTIQRLDHGYYREVETHLERDLGELRQRHGDYLVELIEGYEAGAFDDEPHPREANSEP